MIDASETTQKIEKKEKEDVGGEVGGCDFLRELNQSV